MSKGGSSAPAPDPQIGKAALLQAQTGEEWLSFAKDQFKISNARQVDLDALTKKVTEQQLGIADQQARYSAEDRARYKNTFQPIEDKFIQEASTYDTPEKQAEAAAKAKADVLSASADSRATAKRQAAAIGIDPTSGRYAGIDRAGELGTSLASAGAQNAARQQVADRGLALKADVANLGRGLPAQSAQATSLGLGASSGAVGLNQGTNAQYLQSTGIVSSGFQGQMAGYAGQAQTLNTQYGTQVDAWKAEQQANAASAAGIGKALGGIAGLIFSSDENVKHDKTEIPEGTALSKVMQMPVEEWTYDQGAGDGGRHVGPYAQDFTEQTGSGDGKTIKAQDAIGLTMKAVQDVNQKVDRLADAIGLGDVGADDNANGTEKAVTKKPVKKAKPVAKPDAEMQNDGQAAATKKKPPIGLGE